MSEGNAFVTDFQKESARFEKPINREEGISLQKTFKKKNKSKKAAAVTQTKGTPDNYLLSMQRCSCFSIFSILQCPQQNSKFKGPSIQYARHGFRILIGSNGSYETVKPEWPHLTTPK